MNRDRSQEQDAPEGILTGKNSGPGEVLPQGTVKPGTGSLGQEGPRDWDDMVTHTGEARGVADTALHSLEPDAPTVGAARRGHEIEPDPVLHTQIPTTSNAPD
jgi:hypothetical protein